MERYDLVITGGGAAGINALKAAVTLRARVNLVDRAEGLANARIHLRPSERTRGPSGAMRN